MHIIYIKLRELSVKILNNIYRQRILTNNSMVVDSYVEYGRVLAALASINSILRNQLILGTKDNVVRTKLLSKDVTH